jgi:hypothetical protein
MTGRSHTGPFGLEILDLTVADPVRVRAERPGLGTPHA